MTKRKKAETKRPELLGMHPVRWRKGPNKMSLFKHTPKRKAAPARRHKAARATVTTESARRPNPSRLARLQREDQKATRKREAKLYHGR